MSILKSVLTYLSWFWIIIVQRDKPVARLEIIIVVAVNIRLKKWKSYEINIWTSLLYIWGVCEIMAFCSVACTWIYQRVVRLFGVKRKACVCHFYFRGNYIPVHPSPIKKFKGYAKTFSIVLIFKKKYFFFLFTFYLKPIIFAF